MPSWSHDPPSKGMTTREPGFVLRLHHIADGHKDPEVRSAIGDGLALIVELIESKGKRCDFDEHYDRPHDGG